MMAAGPACNENSWRSVGGPACESANGLSAHSMPDPLRRARVVETKMWGRAGTRWRVRRKVNQVLQPENQP